MYGPVVLAARLGTSGLTAETLRAGPTRPRKFPEYPLEPLPVAPLVVRSPDPASLLQPVAGRPLEFRTSGQKEDVTLVPLNRILDERYAVYFKLIETST
jgi:hypothetical protein